MHDSLAEPIFDISKTQLADETPTIHALIAAGSAVDAAIASRRPDFRRDRRGSGSARSHDQEVAGEVVTPSRAPDEPEAPSGPKPPPHTVEDLLSERQQTHGDFADNARVSQALKRVMRAEPGWEMLTDIEREAMDMIALKISRVLSGKPLERQHWEDITGYAKLAEKECPSH